MSRFPHSLPLSIEAESGSPAYDIFELLSNSCSRGRCRAVARKGERLSTLLFVLRLLPTILAAVQAIEIALPIPAAGKAKLDLVMSTVADVYATEQSIQKELPKDKLLQLVQSLVQRSVATSNALGVFKKSA